MRTLPLFPWSPVFVLPRQCPQTSLIVLSKASLVSQGNIKRATSLSIPRPGISLSTTLNLKCSLKPEPAALTRTASRILLSESLPRHGTNPLRQRRIHTFARRSLHTPGNTQIDALRPHPCLLPSAVVDREPVEAAVGHSVVPINPSCPCDRVPDVGKRSPAARGVRGRLAAINMIDKQASTLLLESTAYIVFQLNMHKCNYSIGY